MPEPEQPTEEQPRLITPEELRAIQEKAVADLKTASANYVHALVASLPRDPMGQPGVQPVQMLADLRAQQFRIDALVTVLQQLAGIDVALPMTQVLAQLYDHNAAELKRVHIATSVGSALNSRKKS